MSDLLTVSELATQFAIGGSVVKAVDGVSLSISKGEIHGLVGESGSGKTVTGLSIIRLVPKPGKIVSGDVELDGIHLLDLPEREMHQVRGKRISMIFQDPLSSLNPTFKIGSQLMDTLHNYDSRMTKSRLKSKAIELLSSVGINDPDTRLEQYPFQVSGGIRQRVMIALAIAGEPDFIIADEPTTNLDVTIQAQILDLLMKIRDRRNISILLITHNLGIVAWACDKVSVMYAGRIVETGPKRDIFTNPLHPYTKLLLKAVPRIYDGHSVELNGIPGEMPDLSRLPMGCHFNPRCPYMADVCLELDPPLRQVEGTESKAACLIYQTENWKKGEKIAG
jgi:oligopeptide/dipeptide ABC transporter ATP-binding protein